LRYVWKRAISTVRQWGGGPVRGISSREVETAIIGSHTEGMTPRTDRSHWSNNVIGRRSGHEAIVDRFIVGLRDKEAIPAIHLQLAVHVALVFADLLDIVPLHSLFHGGLVVQIVNVGNIRLALKLQALSIILVSFKGLDMFDGELLWSPGMAVLED
jgi:hypothetical protein